MTSSAAIYERLDLAATAEEFLEQVRHGGICEQESRWSSRLKQKATRANE
mgnify:CR=1 FL=1